MVLAKSKLGNNAMRGYVKIGAKLENKRDEGAIVSNHDHDCSFSDATR